MNKCSQFGPLLVVIEYCSSTFWNLSQTFLVFGIHNCDNLIHLLNVALFVSGCLRGVFLLCPVRTQSFKMVSHAAPRGLLDFFGQPRTKQSFCVMPWDQTH